MMPIHIKKLNRTVDVVNWRMEFPPTGSEFFQTDDFPASLAVLSEGKWIGLISKRLVAESDWQ